MYIVIAGAGSIGLHIAQRLIDKDKDVVLIEKDFNRAKYLSNHLDCLVINDMANNIEVLQSAGTHKADYFISVTDSDEVNMISCGLVGSEFNVPYKIARVRNLEYSHAKIIQKPFLNIDLIVNPEVEAARVIGETIVQGATSDVITFEKTDVQMRNLFVDATSIFKDRTLREIKQSLNEDFLIGGIARKNTILIPSGDTRVHENDTLYLVSTQDVLERIFLRAGKSTVEIRSIIIVGGGRIGTLAAYLLQEKGYPFKIIEKDYERCKFLSMVFPESLIINADISDEDIFEEERLFDNDLIITATNSQELNILTAMYAKSHGIKRSIAVVVKSSYLTIASELGIDSTVNPKSSAADTILKFIGGSSIESVHSIFDGLAQVMEFSVESPSRVTAVPIRDLGMPENSLIVSVTRDNGNHIPDGDFTIQDNDNVLIISKKKSIPRIERMFSQRP